MHIFKMLSRSHQLGNIKTVLSDSQRKPTVQMAFELLHIALKLRTLPTHYFSSFLYKKNVKNYLDYLDNREMSSIQKVLCDAGAVEILGNKLFFQQYYSMHGIPLPKLVGYNFKECGFVCKKGSLFQYDIRDLDSMRWALELMLPMSEGKSLFVKPISSSCGKGTRKIEVPRPRHAFSLMESQDIQRFFLTGSFLIQDEVLQHFELNNLNCTSVNTVRMDTFRASGEIPEVLSAFLRIGLSGSHIDNIAAGGIFVGIDVLSGTLKPHGYDKLSKGANIYYVHPGSGIQFDGFKLPFFEEAKKLALDAARLIPQAIVGWDIAISSEGPLLLEGNAVYYDVQLSDVAYGGYRNNHAFQKAAAIAHTLTKNVKPF